MAELTDLPDAVVEQLPEGYQVAVANLSEQGQQQVVDALQDPNYDGNADMILGFKNAGIPLRRRTASGINHWKTMIFAGQNTVEFGSANYSPDAFVPVTPYSNSCSTLNEFRPWSRCVRWPYSTVFSISKAPLPSG